MQAHARSLPRSSAGYLVVMFNTVQLRKLGYSDKAIKKLFNWQRKVSPNLSPQERNEIKEKLINAGASPEVVRNVRNIYEGQKLPRPTETLPCGCVIQKYGGQWWYRKLCKPHGKEYFRGHKAREMWIQLNKSKGVQVQSKVVDVTIRNPNAFIADECTAYPTKEEVEEIKARMKFQKEKWSRVAKTPEAKIQAKMFRSWVVLSTVGCVEVKDGVGFVWCPKHKTLEKLQLECGLSIEAAVESLRTEIPKHAEKVKEARKRIEKELEVR